MEDQTINLSALICDSLNSIFFKIFSSIDNTICSNLDGILFINSDITNNSKFQSLFGTSADNGFLLIANSLILGILIFYALNFAFSHLVYSKIDSPYQFLFKCITFVACMNSSLWICEQIINLVSIITESICYIGYSITGFTISFSNLINHINSSMYSSLETFHIFSFDGLLKFCTILGITYIMLIYSIRFILCKVLILLSPFAFISLIFNKTDGFFKAWLKHFLVLLFLQIFVAIVLVVGFCFDFGNADMTAKLTYFAIICIIAKCHHTINQSFSFLFQYSRNHLKKFV